MLLSDQETLPGECVYVITGIANTADLIEQLGDGETDVFLVRALKRAEGVAKHFDGKIVSRAANHLVVLAPTREAANQMIEEIQAKFSSLWVPQQATVRYFSRIDEHMGARRSSRVRARIRYDQETFLLDADAPLFTVGRLPGVTLCIDSERVSRRHARIELQGDKIIFEDTSTNGSFVQFEGKAESTRVHQRKQEIHRNAIISFGWPIEEPKAARISLEILKQGRH
ncbi:MAG: FHA domain protein [Betaproteobacteria bacterium ADurb.Bin341]|nr:MAG: FHA domain protein [Betaproteobacteria bacterium ADurb.Bin341]